MFLCVENTRITIVISPTHVYFVGSYCYRRHGRQKYHGWMLDEELRTLTASEPLSLEEEYEMQGAFCRNGVDIDACD